MVRFKAKKDARAKQSTKEFVPVSSSEPKKKKKIHNSKNILAAIQLEEDIKQKAILKEQLALEEKKKLFIEKAFVFHPTFKLGRIMKIENDDYYIRFQTKTELHRMTFDMVIQSLQVLANDNIIVLKELKMDELKNKVLVDPIWTFKILIKSYGGSITLAEVRKELDGEVVRNYFYWIQRAISKINSDPHFIQISKEGRIAFAYSEEPVEAEDLSNIDLPIIPARFSIYIRPQNFACLSKNHKIESFYTYIPVKFATGIKKIKVYIDHCKNCNKFFISDVEFSSKLGACTQILLRCFISPDGSYYGPKPESSDSGNFSLESALKQAGYTVSKQEDLSVFARQQILDQVILYGIMDVSTVKSYLQFYIGYLGKNENMSDAVDNWMVDLNYVNRRYSKLL